MRNVLLKVFIFTSALSPSFAQTTLEREDLCPPWDEIDPLLPCLEVQSYAELGEVIENAPSGAEITFCPFFLRKVTSVSPITVTKGIRVSCARLAPDQFCSIIGLGHHLVIDTAEDTLWQGFSFRGSNDHMVNVLGDAENSESATHTFCQTSFFDNVRSEDSRGGALMLEKSSGTVNVVESFFQDNFSSTFGAAIYSRANQLNVILSFFIKNRSTGLGPALYVATGGNVMIKTSLFLSNRGRDDHDVVFNPGDGTSIYEDGLGNTANDGTCKGVWNVADESCIVFEKAAPTLKPTNFPTRVPTTSPTATPQTQEPTNKPTARATIQKLTSTPVATPTFNPTTSQTPLPTAKITENPTEKPTTKPSPNPTKEPTAKPSPNPTQVPTTKPTSNPTTTPTKVLTARPSLSPSKRPTNFPTSSPSFKPTNEPSIAPVTPTFQPTSRAPTVGDMIANKCKFQALPEGSACVDVKSFKEFKTAVESASEDIILCGGFNLPKTGAKAVEISNSIDIRCIHKCAFYGFGPFLNIGGTSSRTRLDNMRFINSRDASAVIVSTRTKTAQTTFCDTEFERNQLSEENANQGGAITVVRGSGVVNVVNNTFTANIASHGGAIHSEGFKLNVVESRFVANNAYDAGNAIFVGSGNYLSIHSSTFILNTEVVSRYSGREKPNSSFAIVVEPNLASRAGPQDGTFIDGGGNTASLSGTCGGAVLGTELKCQTFN